MKALMVDVDGVIVHPAHSGGWAACLETDLGISIGLLQTAFFQPHWQDVSLGRAGLEERLAPVLAKIAPHLRVEVLMDYWFRYDACLNEPLLADLAVWRSRGVALHLATVQEHQRARYLWEDLGLRDRFDAIHYSAALGCAKPDLAFYRAIEAKTGFAPRDLLLIDDKPGNVEGAWAAGWRGVLWDGALRLGQVLEAQLLAGKT